MTYLNRRASTLHAAGLCLLLWATQLMASTYYVATTGDDAQAGLSPTDAWRTVTHAATVATAGDIVYIKAGLYTGESVNILHSGAADAPLVFQGYTSTPGEIIDPRYVPGAPLDSSLLPVLMGDAKGLGITVDTRSGKIGHIEIRNLGISNFANGIAPDFQDSRPGYAHHIIVDNVYVTEMGDNGMWFRDCDAITVRNCVVTNGQMVNIFFDITHNSVIENCRCYAVYSAPGWIATDYHICLQDSSNNTVRNCMVRNMHDDQTLIHPGHGIGVKDRVYHWTDDYYFPHSTNNKFIDCTSYHMGENFFVAHESYGNEFSGCAAIAHFRDQYYWSDGLVFRDGAHDNRFRNCRVTGSRTALVFRDEPEGPGEYGGAARAQTCSRNTVENCVFADASCGIEIGNAADNQIRNSVFDEVETVLVQNTKNDTYRANVCRNSIVTNTSGGYQADWGTGERLAFIYSNFWNNSFWGIAPNMPPGEGNMEQDPLFADRANRDYHLRSAFGRWNGTAWVSDAATSPCIDAGNPGDDCSKEPSPNGNRINIGVYGGGAEASKSAGIAPAWGPNAGLNLTVLRVDANLVLRIEGAQIGDTITIQISPDLIIWTTTETRSVDEVVENYTDTGANEQDRRFYRVARSASL